MLGWIAETTVVTAGIALVALLASRLLANNPTIRHALWLVVLIKLITPPLVSWPWAARWQALDWPITTSQPAIATSGKIFVNANQPQAASCMDEQTDVEVVSHEIDPVPPIMDGTPVREPAVQPAFTFAAVPGRFGFWSQALPEPVTLVRFMAWSWLAVSVILGVAQTIRIFGFRRRLRSAVPAQPT